MFVRRFANKINTFKPVLFKNKFISQPHRYYSLTKFYPNTPSLHNNEGETELKKSKISELSNKVTVISTDSYNPQTALTVKIARGSRDETKSGLSHYASRSFYGATNNRSRFNFIKSIQELGAEVATEVGREDISYKVNVLREGVPSALELLSDGILQGRFHEYDFFHQRKHVQNDLDQNLSNPYFSVMEELHRVAYSTKTLGKPLICPQYNVKAISHLDVVNFMNENYTGENITIIGNGIEHDLLVGQATELFGEVETSSANQRIGSVYTGGDSKVFATGQSIHDSPVHVALAFEGTANVELVKYYAFEILKNIIGAGRKLNYSRGISQPIFVSFGSSSPTQVEIVDKEESIQDASAFNLGYQDSGLFGIYLTGNDVTKVTSPLLKFKDLLNSISNGSIDQDVFVGAVKRTTLDLALNAQRSTTQLNQLFVQFDKTPEEHFEAISQVTPEQVKEAAAEILKSKASLVSFGDVEGAPTANEFN